MSEVVIYLCWAALILAIVVASFFDGCECPNCRKDLYVCPIKVIGNSRWRCIQRRCDGVHHLYVRAPDA